MIFKPDDIATGCLEHELDTWKTLSARLSKTTQEVSMLTPTRHEESQTNPSQTTRPKQPKRPRPKQPKNECPSKPVPNKDHRSKQPRKPKLTTLNILNLNRQIRKIETKHLETKQLESENKTTQLESENSRRPTHRSTETSRRPWPRGPIISDKAGRVMGRRRPRIEPTGGARKSLFSFNYYNNATAGGPIFGFTFLIKLYWFFH